MNPNPVIKSHDNDEVSLSDVNVSESRAKIVFPESKGIH